MAATACQLSPEPLNGQTPTDRLESRHLSAAMRLADALKSCRVGIAALCSVLLCALPLGAQTLRIYQIDVEQADAALLVMPNGKTLLIDSGLNAGAQRIRDVMTVAGVTRIDAFVNSHYHEDHYGGIDNLVDAGVEVLEAYDRGDKDCCLDEKKEQEPAFKAYQRTVGEDATVLRAGDVIALDPLVTITTIASGGVVIGETTRSTSRRENDMSVSLLINFQGFRAFFGGDTEGPTEAKIAARDLVLDVDLYKSSHHGSDTSSTSAFMIDLRPSVVVISNGSHGGHKHPRQIPLNTYAGLHGPPAVFQTNKCFASAPCGNVPDAQIADPETKDQDGTILITVNAATNDYTLEYGTTSRTFAVKAPTAPRIAPPAGVVITSLLPNPVGDDEQLEAIAIQNRDSVAVSLVGWIVRDRSGTTSNLTGALAPGHSRTFRRNGQAMSLNNAGDAVDLVNPAGTVVQSVTYEAVDEGELVTPVVP